MHFQLDQIGIVVLLYHLNKDNYYCDYFYQGNTTTYPRHGGSSNNASACGAFCVTSNASNTAYHWSICASLSFKK